MNKRILLSNDNNNTIINNQASFKEYYKNQVNKTTMLYKIIISCLILVNSIIILFFIIFLNEISTMTKSNNLISNNIITIEASNSHTQSIINNQLVNLHMSKYTYHKEFLQIVKSKAEYDLIIEWLYSNYNGVYLCYSEINDIKWSYEFFYFCKHDNNLIFIFETEKGNRFGAALFNFNYYETSLPDNQAFLFNLDTKIKFAIGNPNEAYIFSKLDNMIVFGNNDLVVNLNDRQSYSNFPKRYGNINNDTIDNLTGGEKSFTITKIEIIAKINFR